MVYEWGRFTYWIAQGQNAIAVQTLAALATGVFTLLAVYLAFRSVRIALWQASGQLQPSLALRMIKPDETPGSGLICIQNKGQQPAVLLDVKLECHLNRSDYLQRFEPASDSVIAAGENSDWKFDFTRMFKDQAVSAGSISYGFTVVCSDLHRTAIVTYYHLPFFGTTECRLGQPWSVRVRRMIKPVKWRYWRIHYFVRDLIGRSPTAR